MACITRPVVAVLPAAGKGERFKSATPKQFSLINGQPLILYTLKSLQRIKWVQKIYVAISESWFNFVENLISQNKLSKVELVQGGDTRHESIKKCVFAIHAKAELDASADNQMKGSPIVIVHDAVRPFVGEETYCNVAKAAEKYQASGAVCGLVSTVLSVTEDGFLDQALNRSVHAASHTPQAFTLDIIKTAYDRISAVDLAKGTECLDLALKHCGVKAKLVPAPDEVWKVTYHKDIHAAEALAREQNVRIMVICQQGKTELSEEICRQLVSHKVLVKQGESIGDISIDAEINSVVLILNHSIEENVSAPLSKSFREVNSAFSLLKDVQSTLTVVIQCHQELTDLDYRHLRDHAKELRRSSDHEESGKLTHFVLWEENQAESATNCISKVSRLAANLVFDKNSSMNGQVFILP